LFVLDEGKRVVVPRTELTYPGHNLKLRSSKHNRLWEKGCDCKAEQPSLGIFLWGYGSRNEWSGR